MSVYATVRCSRDPRKSDSNLAERGFDFEFATPIFDEPTFELQDQRIDYAERRVVAVGAADGLHLTVVYTDRPGRAGVIRRIISARRSNQRERVAYAQAHQQEA